MPNWLGYILLIASLACFLFALLLRNMMLPKHRRLSLLQQLYASGMTLKIMILIAPVLWWATKVIFG